ncbi:hypothetical protein [Comamonas sp. NoAH]|nr:hypothetical protein [Comamonas sp. NoAH]
MTFDLNPGPAEADFGHTPPPTYPEPRSPEEVRELLKPTEEHQSEAI